jgi:hypothetical protein
MFDNSSVSSGNGTELCRYPDYNHPPWDEERSYLNHMFDNCSVNGGNGTELCRYPDYNHPLWDEERSYLNHMCDNCSVRRKRDGAVPVSGLQPPAVGRGEVLP